MMPGKLLLKIKTDTAALEPMGVRGKRNIVPLAEATTLGIREMPAGVENEWDKAHRAVAETPEVFFAEPEVESAEPFYPDESAKTLNADADEERDKYKHFISDWEAPEEPDVWHIKQEFAQLQAAREHVYALNDKKKIRIAHFDTGYDEEHESFPRHLVNTALQRNFVDGEEEENAEDRFSTGLMRMPGHGAGTLSLLAGEKMPVMGCDDFNDYVGLKDIIEIVPIRVAKSVVLFKSAAFVQAMNYVLNELNAKEETRVQVITMSMGGVASDAWADVVNAAYEQGVFMVTAAGNNFMKLPTKRLVYPARFNRVVAACGVTYDFSPYVKPPGQGSLSIMEGNHGPRKLMDTALAAFTPNVPWAVYKFKDVFGIRGNGTSSATPQIAATAALYYSKYYKALEQLPEPWMKVEAIRHALFSSALKNVCKAAKSYDYYFGNGILKAYDALQVPVPAETELEARKQPKDRVSFPFFRLIFGLRRRATEAEKNENAMLETELMQLALTDARIQELIDNDETDDLAELSRAQQLALANLVLANGRTSNRLKENMRAVVERIG